MLLNATKIHLKYTCIYIQVFLNPRFSNIFITIYTVNFYKLRIKYLNCKLRNKELPKMMQYF